MIGWTGILDRVPPESPIGFHQNTHLGYTVLHLEAELVLNALPQAVERVREAVELAQMARNLAP